MSAPATIQLQSRAFWARITSYFKRNWTLDDYPILFRFHPTSGAARGTRLKPTPYSASIVNWPALLGVGGSKSEALDDLRKHFDQFKVNNRLPRPGTNVPVQFASTKRVNSHTALAEDFLARIFELDWAFISDESSLWDFHHSENDTTLFEKIRSTYGVDVSDIPSGNLAEIFDRIAAHSRPVS